MTRFTPRHFHRLFNPAVHVLLPMLRLQQIHKHRQRKRYRNLCPRLTVRVKLKTRAHSHKYPRNNHNRRTRPTLGMTASPWMCLYPDNLWEHQRSLVPRWFPLISRHLSPRCLQLQVPLATILPRGQRTIQITPVTVNQHRPPVIVLAPVVGTRNCRTISTSRVTLSSL